MGGVYFQNNLQCVKDGVRCEYGKDDMENKDFSLASAW
jgi:hypothetical protein